ncbi:ACP S-malonyltransferase [Listeria monocytogenes]|uniref:ACP S-malonyltransferase n=1 Tax=Listeria monocytogenes TaxID=1639 RepID=UPI0010EA721A|nr:ACP S-malonyltransferase [Listeria monocytogenes]EAD7632594.1 ACP S-malonyltransferase [Listeria monocytogenes]
MNIAVLFPGQGAAVPKELIQLWTDNEQAKKVILQAEKILGEPIYSWFTEDLSQDTWKAQITTYISGLCMYQLYKEEIGLYPQAAMGHSLGELTALTVAGIVDFENGLRLVDIRGKSMKKDIEKQTDQGMMAIFRSREEIEPLVKEESEIFIANTNANKQTVISGSKTAIRNFVKKHHLDGVLLNVSGAFHTEYMKAAAEEVKNQIQQMSFSSSSSMHVISNRTAQFYTTEKVVSEIVEQIISPVKWLESIKYAEQTGTQCFIDLSPAGMFVKMLKNEAPIYALEPGKTNTAIEAELKEEVQVNRNYDLFSRALGIIVSTKNNGTDPDTYENIVVSGYNQIKANIGKEVTEANVKDTLDLLDLILRSKKVPVEEIDAYKTKLSWEAAIS